MDIYNCGRSKEESELIDYVNELVDSNPNIKTVYIPEEAYSIINVMSRFSLRKPAPPRYLSGDHRSSGFFSWSRSETWEYDFNDPDYLEALERYKKKKSDLQKTEIEMTLMTCVGYVTIKPSNKLKYNSRSRRSDDK